MDFEDFPRILGKSGCESHPPPRRCVHAQCVRIDLSLACGRFKGAVVVVTHHQKFMEGLLTEKWHVADGGVTFKKDGEEAKEEKPAPPKAKPTTGTHETRVQLKA